MDFNSDIAEVVQHDVEMCPLSHALSLDIVGSDSH